jgi:hypothetical protein
MKNFDKDSIEHLDEVQNDLINPFNTQDKYNV